MKKVKSLSLFAVSIFLIICVFSSLVYAHPGRLDSNGGHHDYINGGYHYHDGSSSGKQSSNSFTYNSDSSTNKNTNSIKTFIIVISVLLIIVTSLIAFFSIRKRIRRKKALYYLSVLKPQFEEIKNKELLLKTNNTHNLISSLQDIKKKKYEIDYSFYVKLFSLYTLEELCKPPEGIKIINNEIVDELSQKEYGRYTAYKTYSGKTIHSKRGCSGAYIPINILSLNYDDSKKKPCKICCSSKYNDLINSPPEWYLEYKKIQKIKKKYNIE